MHFLEMCKDCVGKGLLPDESEAFYKLLLDYRNYIAHAYKQPSLDTLIKYTKLYRKSFDSVYKCMFEIAYNPSTMRESKVF